MEASFLRIVAVVVGLGGMVYSAHLMWVYFFRPLRDFTDAQSTLVAIAREFRPNGGRSLVDRIDLINIRLANIEQRIERITDQIGPWDGKDRRYDD